MNKVAQEIKQSAGLQGRERWETLTLDQLDQEIDKIQQRYLMAATSFHSPAVLDQLQGMIVELTMMRDEKIDTQAYTDYIKTFPQTIELDKVPEKLTNKIDTSKVAATFNSRHTWEKRGQTSDDKQESGVRSLRQPNDSQGDASRSSGESFGGRFTSTNPTPGKRDR